MVKMRKNYFLEEVLEMGICNLLNFNVMKIYLRCLISNSIVWSDLPPSTSPHQTMELE